MKKESIINNVIIELSINLEQIKPKNPQLKFSYKENPNQLYKEKKINIQLEKNGEIWNTSFRTTFNFTTLQAYRLDILIDAQGSIGSIQFTIGQLIRTGKQIKQCLHFSVTLEAKLLQRGESIFWQWSGQKLLNTDGFFNKSDPFLQFYSWDEGQWNLVHQTEYIENNLNPIWSPFEIDMGLLNYSDDEKIFVVECWDNSKKNPPNHKFIGKLEISYTQIVTSGNKEFILTNPEHKQCGELKLLSCQLTSRKNLFTLLRNQDIQTIIIIDMSRTSASFHTLSHESSNIFQKLLISIGTILLQYHSQNTLQLYGIGGILHGTQSTINHFLISKGQNDLQKICQDYSNAAKQIQHNDKSQITSALFEIIKQAESFKQNFTVGITILVDCLFDQEEFQQFISHCMYFIK